MEQEKWTISFVSDAGVSYKVSIYEEGFTGTAIVLSPASSPFTITEKNGNDIFEPIHTQSGYISVICDTQTFESLIPTDYKHHRVILRSGTNIIWTGWMSPESYNVPTRNTVQEYKFPVVCGISVLDCQDMPVAYSRMSIARIIATCLPTEYQNVYIQDNVDDMLELQLTASVFNFMEKNDSISIENGEPYYIPRMTLKTILECVCRFFGWSLHTQGNSVFLTSPDVDDDHLVKFYAQDLYWEDLVRAERVRYNSAALTSIIPADTSAKTEIIRGYKTIIIDSSVNESTEVFSFDIGKAKMSAIRTTDVYIEGEAYKDAVWNIQMEPLADEAIPGMEVYGANIEDYYLRMYEWDVQDPEFVHDYAEFYKEDIFKTADAPRKHNYDWNTVFKLVTVTEIGAGTAVTRYAMRFTTNREYTFSNGMLCIAADVWSGEYNTNRTTVRNTGLHMSIKVGDKYWNGSSWQSTEIFLLIETGDDTKTDTSSSDYYKGRGKIITSKHYTEHYEEAEGYGIRIGAHDVITGRVEITLGRAIDGRFQKYELSNFRVFFASAVNTTKHVESNNTYKRKISEKFTDEYSVKNEFSSWNNNKIGEALLAEPDIGFVSTLPYDKGNIRPEIYLLDRMQAHFSRFTKRLTVPAIGIPEETPLTKYSYGGAIYYAIGREMDYIKDKVTLTLDSL